MFDKLFLFGKDEGDMIVSEGEEEEEIGSDDEAVDTARKLRSISQKKVSIPNLMCLGLLYCPSNRRQRAEKFYELVEIQLTNHLSAADKEFREYVPYLYEISYKFMFRLYERHRDQTPPTNGGQILQPEVEVKKFLPLDYETDEILSQKFTKKFVDTLFQSRTNLKRKQFEDRLAENVYNLLQPHDIRKNVYDKFSEIQIT